VATGKGVCADMGPSTGTRPTAVHPHKIDNANENENIVFMCNFLDAMKITISIGEHGCTEEIVK